MKSQKTPRGVPQKLKKCCSKKQLRFLKNCLASSATFLRNPGTGRNQKIGNEIDSKAVKLAVTLREYTHSDTSYLLTVKAGIARCIHFTAHSFLRQTNMYNLRPRPDKQLEMIASTLPQDCLYMIALLHHCQPKHRYRLRKRNSS